MRAQGLVRSFEQAGGTLRALAGVSLTVEAGEFVSIMGPSGSGKSTLLYCLGCLDRPTAGTIELGGEPVEELDDRSLSALRNRRIGFVFQSFNLLPTSTLADNVGLPMVYAGLSRARRRERAARLLEAVGLGKRLDDYPTQLSGGQAQRVAIARALANGPAVLLADEPTGNLDSHTGREVMRLFGELNRLGLTILMVTHDPQIARHSGRIVRVMDGAILEDVPVPDPIREEGSEESKRLLELLSHFGSGGPSE
ncbi:MAG: ABC transporter ATP-binding protein [Candidatus Wallbacteria bacterium]|nr:ABC transporter ATP-binding protein [Candidatus Wallbacteria bacterium]